MKVWQLNQTLRMIITQKMMKEKEEINIKIEKIKISQQIIKLIMKIKNNIKKKDRKKIKLINILMELIIMKKK